MSRVLKWLIGLTLLPFCAAATMTLLRLMREMPTRSPDFYDWSIWWLPSGFCFWLVLFMVTPRPVRTYIVAHECTHALWGLLMGARINAISVDDEEGSVELSKTNFLITLAPYFFPFYTVLVILLHAGLSLFWDLHAYEPFWLGAIGITWGFHFTFTLAMLLNRQPDIVEQGRVFSYAVIYLFNVLGIALWIVMVTPITLSVFLTQVTDDILMTWAWFYEAAAAVFEQMAEVARTL